MKRDDVKARLAELIDGPNSPGKVRSVNMPAEDVRPIADRKRADHRRKIIFDKVRAAALAGERCPSNDDFAVPNAQAYFAQMAKAGRYRVELYAMNYRAVVFPDGKTTRRPERGKPFRIIDKGGTFYVKKKAAKKGAGK